MLPSERCGKQRLCLILPARLSSRGIGIAGLVVWNRPMPLDPRHNSKIVYKQLAVNMAGAIDLIRNCDYTGMPTGAGQTVKMGEHHASVRSVERGR